MGKIMKLIGIEKKVEDFQLKINELIIEEGKIHGFIGGNGSGKTTTAKMIMGILEPDKGIISYEGLHMRDITMTSQRPYLLHDTVYENIVYPLKLRGIKPDLEKIDEWLRIFGMLDKKKQYARSLSSGEQQKLSMIRALIFEPRFIIVDESLSNMDPESVEKFENMILEIQKIRPVTWIMISHRLAHIYKLCDRLHFFSHGHILASGSKDYVLFESGNEEIEGFVSKEMIIRNHKENSDYAVFES